MQSAPADDVGHERVAGRKPAAGKRKRERPQVHAVARPAASLGKVTLQDHAQTTLELPLARAGPVRQPESVREVAQKLEQRQSGRAADSIRCAAASGTATAPRRWLL